MEKPRPPIHLEDSESSDSLKLLIRYTEVMIRKYLRTPPNAYPRFLYKYISETMPDEYLKCLLIDCDFYLNSPIDFNDPFDTTAQIIDQGTLSEKRAKFRKVVNSNAQNLTRQEKENIISTRMAEYSNNPDFVKNMFNKNVQAAGIYSLTENPRNILMWSHYASHHRGMVLQFNISRDIESLLNALKMHYSKEYPKFGILTDFNRVFKDIMLGKSEDWSYEVEWRILKIGGANTYLNFKPEALTGLIFGCRATENYKNKIKTLLTERSQLFQNRIELYDAKMHESMYGLKIFKHD